MSVEREPPPRVTIPTDLPLHVGVEALRDAMVAANDEHRPSVMVRGNELVRLTERGVLEDLNLDALRVMASRVAQFEKTTSNGPVAVNPPMDVVRGLRSADSAEYGDLPRVDRMVDVPVLSASGELITRPGYHASDRLYYRPAKGLESLEIPEAGSIRTVDEVLDARQLLVKDLLGDFEFADDASRAHALGMLLLPFVRDYIQEPTPIHAVTSSEPGVGKGLLVQAALLPGCGTVGITAGAGSDDAEWRKKITSQLLRGKPAVAFDNLHGTLESASLAAAVTTEQWDDRVLGENRDVSLPVRNVWAATAVNLSATNEHARRIVPIFLTPDPNRPPPSERERDSWQQPNLLRWATKNRKQLVEAALVLIRHWLDGDAWASADGSFVRLHELDGGDPYPQRADVTLGSYDVWAGTIGGILSTADVPGFLDPENRKRLNAEVNEERQETSEFLAAWHRLGSEPLVFSDVLALCEHGGALRDVLPETLGGRDLRTQLGQWLKTHKGQRFGGYQLIRHEGSGHGNRRRWEVRHRG